MAELTVVAKDRVGLLADISYALGKAGLNIEFVSVATTPRTAIVHLKVAKTSEAINCLNNAGFKVVDRPHLFLHVKDQPGELAMVTRKLADAGINIKETYIVETDKDEKIMALDTSDNANAKKVLSDYVLAHKK